MRSIIVPSLRFSQSAYTDKMKEVVRPDMRWLDLGCGHHLLPLWKEEEEFQIMSVPKVVVGLDYDFASLSKHRSIKLRVQGDIGKLPFRKKVFHLITANMVVEHLKDPAEQFKEIARVLKDDGMFLFHTPNSFGYTTVLSRLVPEFLKTPLISLLEGRASADVFPTFYRANSEKKIAALAKEAGLELRMLHYLVTDAQFAMILPVAFFELIWIRLLMLKPMRKLRPNLIVVLQKSKPKPPKR